MFSLFVDVVFLRDDLIVMLMQIAR